MAHQTSEGSTEQAELIPSMITVVWDPEILSEDEYADLIVAIGNLVRAEGGLGVERVRSQGFGIPCEVGVPL